MTASMITKRSAKVSECESNILMYVFVYESMEIIFKYIEIDCIVMRGRLHGLFTLFALDSGNGVIKILNVNTETT